MSSLLVILLVAAVSNSLAQQPANCGTKGPRKFHKIVGGQVTTYNEFPWQISLQYRGSSGWYHTCGGTIITDGHVLTAAHCIDGREIASNFRVRVGEWDTAVRDQYEEDIGVAAVSKKRVLACGIDIV